MATIARSDDPRFEGVLRPKTLNRTDSTPLAGMKLRSPKRASGRIEAAQKVDKTLRRMCVTNDELDSATEAPVKLFEGWRDAREGVQIGDLFALADAGGARQALAIIDMARARIYSCVVAQSAHED